MADDTKDAERLAQLEAEVAALKAAQPKPQQSAEEVERSMAKARDELHQMREGRMNYAMPPSVHQYFADGVTAADCADLARAAHAPTGPSSQGAIPSSQQVSNVRGAGGPVGWQHDIPIGPPPGVNYADRLMDAQDAKDRAELIERDAKLKAMRKMAERK